MSGKADELVHDGVPGVVGRLFERVAHLEGSQPSEDVNGFLSLLGTDATWVSGGGRRLAGLREIAEFTRSVPPGAFAREAVRADALTWRRWMDVCRRGRAARRASRR